MIAAEYREKGLSLPAVRFLRSEIRRRVTPERLMEMSWPDPGGRGRNGEVCDLGRGSRRPQS